MRYRVYDSQGNYMKSFPDYKQASNYKLAFGNIYWRIKS